jgi:polar amino acid transport system substrate-binding protein
MVGKKKATVIAAAAMLLASCGGTGGGDTGSAKGSVSPPKKLAHQGSLTYGTAASFPPFEYKEGSEPTGFDIDMGRQLAAELGLKPQALDIDFDGLIPALKGGRVDIINSAMYMNPERAKEVDFIPYMRIGEAMITRKDSPVSIKSVPNDLSGLTVAVTRGAIGETYMNSFNKQLQANGKPVMKIMTLPTNQDALAAVASKRADAFDTSTPGGAYTISQSPDMKQQATFALSTKIGIAVRKGDTSMRDAVRKALKKFVASGGYDKLMKKYNLPAQGTLFK